MKPAMLIVMALAALTTSAAAQSTIHAPGSTATIDVVAHVDILPDNTAQALDAIAMYVQAARGEPGALRVEAMQEVRQNHFDVVETWRDEAAWRTHQSSAAKLALRHSIGPWLGSPLDERIGTPVR